MKKILILCSMLATAPTHSMSKEEQTMGFCFIASYVSYAFYHFYIKSPETREKEEHNNRIRQSMTNLYVASNMKDTTAQEKHFINEAITELHKELKN
jgi:hypothetical protein